MRYRFEMICVWLKRGFKVRRASWPKGEYIYLNEFNDVIYHWVSIGNETHIDHYDIYMLSGQDIVAGDWMLANVHDEIFIHTRKRD